MSKNARLLSIEPLEARIAPAYAAVVNLGELPTSDALIVSGLQDADHVGQAVAGIGDFNGDGIGDMLIGVPRTSLNGVDSGAAAIIFGTNSGFSGSFRLGDINGSNGMLIVGAAAGDQLGFSVAGLGDLNGDGASDIVIGAPGEDVNGVNSGAVYVIYGGAARVLTTLDLSQLSSARGFRINGANEGDLLGYSVASGSDFNDDNLVDVVVGAPGNSDAGAAAGAVYVVHGRAENFPVELNVATMLAAEGSTIRGMQAGGELGTAVSGLGDVDGDQISDLLLGAPGLGTPGTSGTVVTGAAHVVYGGTVSGGTLTLSTTSGPIYYPANSVGARAGSSVSAAGDFNGDGLSELIIGAPLDDLSGTDRGSALVVLGGVRQSGYIAFASDSQRYLIAGQSDGDQLGMSVSAGNHNGDGFTDVAIGIPGLDVGTMSNAGGAVVLFGRSGQNVGGVVSPSALGENGGLLFRGANFGANTSQAFGTAISLRGDANADGYSDLIVGGVPASGAAIVTVLPGEGRAGGLTLSNDGRTASFIEADGDRVTVKITKGRLTLANFRLSLDPVENPSGYHFKTLDLTNSPATFHGTKVTITAKPTDLGGDGYVRLGALLGDGFDFSSVKITGGLGRITAGDGNYNTKAVGSLSVGILGSTIESLSGSYDSRLFGSVGSITAQNIIGGSITIARRAAEANVPLPDLGKLTVGGSINALTLQVEGRTSAIKAFTLRGSAVVSNELSSLSVAVLDGVEIRTRVLGKISVTYDMTNTNLFAIGNLNPTSNAAATALKSLTVGGYVSRSNIYLGYADGSTPVNPSVQAGPIKVGGDWVGSSVVVGVGPGTDGFLGFGDDAVIGANSNVTPFSRIASITIKGQLLGTASRNDVHLFTAHEIGPVKIGGALAPLTKGAGNDTTALIGGVHRDHLIREI